MKRQIVISIEKTEGSVKDWEKLRSHLGKILINASAVDRSGKAVICWDDAEVQKKHARNAGNEYRRPDLRIEEVIEMLKEYEAQRYRPGKKTKTQYIEERLGISISTYNKRLRFLTDQYGSLEKALNAGKTFFTDQPGIR